jgi:hypothetical protein
MVIRRRAVIVLLLIAFVAAAAGILWSVSRPPVKPTVSIARSPETGVNTVEIRGALDTFVSEYGEDVRQNYDGYYWLYTRGGAGTREIPYLKFDLSVIPSYATISTCVLSLYNTPVNGNYNTTIPVEIHRVKVANSGWSATTATWEFAAVATAWAGGENGGSVSGTDYWPTVMGTLTYGPTDPAWKEYNITLDTTEFASMFAANYGMELIQRVYNSNTSVASSDYPDVGGRPKLTVTYYINNTPTPTYTPSSTATSTPSTTPTPSNTATSTLTPSITPTETPTYTPVPTPLTENVVTLFDTFTGAGPLATHTPDVYPAGSHWTVVTGAGDALANGLYTATSPITGVLAIVNGGISDYRLQADVRAPESGVVYRSDSDGQTKYVLLPLGTSFALQVYTTTTGYTTLGTSAAGSVISVTGAISQIGVDAYGSLTRFYNGAANIWDWWTPTYSTSTYIGLRGATAWDTITLTTNSGWKTIRVLGSPMTTTATTDSMNAVLSKGAGALWPYIAGRAYNGAKTFVQAYGVVTTTLSDMTALYTPTVTIPADQIWILVDAIAQGTVEPARYYTPLVNLLADIQAECPGCSQVYVIGPLDVQESVADWPSMNAYLYNACQVGGATYITSTGWITYTDLAQTTPYPIANATTQAKVGVALAQTLTALDAVPTPTWVDLPTPTPTPTP